MADLTEEQKSQVYFMKAHFPYRIAYGVFDKDTGEFTVSAATSMKMPNKLTREGHKVFVLK